MLPDVSDRCLHTLIIAIIENEFYFDNHQGYYLLAIYKNHSNNPHVCDDCW